MRVLNETLKKLTRDEIAGLDLYNHGIYTYNGVAKARVKGFKTTLRTEDEVHYESENTRWELIKLVGEYKDIFKDTPTNCYALRCFNKVENNYEDWYQILAGCKFVK